jgi:glycosyltransferase involved in cell wall biosynthesis
MNEKALKPPNGSVNPPRNLLASGERLKIAVGIATAGRRVILDYTLDLIARQTRLPDDLIVCPAAVEDLDAESLQRLPFTTAVRIGKRGLTVQRNQILSAADTSDVIVFFDDDFFPQLNYLEEVEKLFLRNADVVAVTGRPILDGANGPGVAAETALKLIYADEPVAANQVFVPTYGTYGCNMAFRMDPIRQHGLLFDENLPLYGWQEDIDFSRQLSGFGRIVDAKALRGVHLGAKGGRTSGVRFGYSQIANPVYLIRKGTVSIAFAGPLVCRNVLANLGKSFRPEPWIDRRGRLMGNCLALRDLLVGRIEPKRILELK